MRRVLQALGPIQTTGFTISIIVPLFLLFIGQEKINSITLGFTLAAFTQLLDLQYKLHESEKRVLSSKELDKALYRDEWLLECLTAIVKSYQEITVSFLDPFEFKSNAQEYLHDCRNRLNRMADGHDFPIERIPFEQSMTALRKARQCVKAVDTGDLAFWEEAYVTKYIALNAEVVRAGIPIKRVFIHPITALTGKLDLLRKQQDIGIEILIVDPTKNLPQALQGDYILVDDSYAAMSIFGSDGKVVRNKVSVNQGEIKQLVRNFDNLLNYTITLDEMMDRLSSKQESQ